MLNRSFLEILSEIVLVFCFGDPRFVKISNLSYLGLWIGISPNRDLGLVGLIGVGYWVGENQIISLLGLDWS